MNLTTRLSSKGQIVLPKAIRASQRLRPGMEFVIKVTREGLLLKPKISEKKLSWDDIIGCANYKGPRASIRQMDEAVMAEARRHK